MCARQTHALVVTHEWLAKPSTTHTHTRTPLTLCVIWRRPTHIRPPKGRRGEHGDRNGTNDAFYFRGSRAHYFGYFGNGVLCFAWVSCVDGVCQRSFPRSAAHKHHKCVHSHTTQRTAHRMEKEHPFKQNTLASATRSTLDGGGSAVVHKHFTHLLGRTSTKPHHAPRMECSHTPYEHTHTRTAHTNGWTRTIHKRFVGDVDGEATVRFQFENSLWLLGVLRWTREPTTTTSANA